MRRLFPRPALSVAIFLLWAALANAASLGMLLLGAVLALALPFVSKPFWPDAPRLARPGTMLTLAARVVLDIVIANGAVARRVIGPVARLEPAFVEVPLDLRDPFVATILASIVSLTPGTVSIDVDQESWVLCLHALDAPDPAALIREIKQRYEAPLKEIFTC
ncbi:MAG: Na+/H+ antiporter subunit E [Gammaproteobacteria bacterium]|nr:Na+/H+ antiporter subunit E [Gammaproteobacteria bacterium]MBU1977705.1 Na+/H+ antiporter subunit E [Gammaproteobacteria bacterium]